MYEQLDDLIHAPVDLILLKWMNYHLKSQGYSKFVDNFGSELRDSEELAILISCCSRAPNSCLESSGGLPPTLPEGEEDLQARAHEIVRRLALLNCPKLVTINSITSDVADLNLALISYLFCNFPQLQPEVSPLDGARLEVNHADEKWREFNRQWNDRPAEVKSENISLQKLNILYHLLRCCASPRKRLDSVTQVNDCASNA